MDPGQPHLAQAGEVLSELFERRVAVTPVPAGTATNALSMSLLSDLCGGFRDRMCSHIHTSEGGGDRVLHRRRQDLLSI